MTRSVLPCPSGMVSPGRHVGTAVRSVGGSAGVPFELEPVDEASHSVLPYPSAGPNRLYERIALGAPVRVRPPCEPLQGAAEV